MIKINDIEILTVLDGMIWSGSKDNAVRNLNFQFLYNPLKKDIPKYQVKCGDKVVWQENGKILFQGYIEKLDYNTDEDVINLSCIDCMSYLKRSKFVGRMYGTLNEIANKICGAFNLENGINVDSSIIHNIVSTGDMTYYDVLFTACKTMFKYFNLYIDGITLKLAEHTSQGTFEIGKNIRSSSFNQDMSQMITKVIVIDNDGRILNTIENSSELQNFGLFQEIYNYNKDSKDNPENIQELLNKKIENKAIIVADNDNNCISGRFIEVYEPVNNYKGLFEIQTDQHTINSDSFMQLEIKLIEENV